MRYIFLPRFHGLQSQFIITVLLKSFVFSFRSQRLAMTEYVNDIIGYVGISLTLYGLGVEGMNA